MAAGAQPLREPARRDPVPRRQGHSFEGVMVSSDATPPRTPASSPGPAIPNLVRFGREICGDLGQAERREWWLANGLGGYAAGTIAGTLTRRYHGLLVAPVNPPLGRVLVAAKADATYIKDGREVPLFSNRWPGGSVDPNGHLLIESFHLDGRMPVWRYQ